MFTPAPWSASAVSARALEWAARTDPDEVRRITAEINREPLSVLVAAQEDGTLVPLSPAGETLIHLSAFNEPDLIAQRKAEIDQKKAKLRAGSPE